MRKILSIGAMICSISAFCFAQATQPTTRGVDLNTGQSFEIQAPTTPPPKEWVDPETGHRVIRLSDEPGSMSLYFHQYCFSLDKTKLDFQGVTGIYDVDLATRKIDKIVGNDDGRVTLMQTGRKTGHLYYSINTKGQQTVYWIDRDEKVPHKIATMPAGNNVSTVNCDETLMAGAVTYLDGRGGSATRPVRAAAGQRIDLNARWSQHLPMALITLNIANGEIKTFNPSNDWDNHFQFSPTDPTMLMYCHEGPWQNNDRVWGIHTDGTGLFKPHTRTMINEIWGHEFWSGDGRTMWYQLSYPRGTGGTGWIAGYNLDTKQETWYLNAPNTTSIHVNVCKDGTMFAGDGGNSAPWIFLFRPTLTRNMAQGVYDASHLIQPGYLAAEKLVNMSKHQYQLEPNPIFTPDEKWVIFRSNMFGASYAFMVEIAKVETKK